MEDEENTNEASTSKGVAKEKNDAHEDDDDEKSRDGRSCMGSTVTASSRESRLQMSGAVARTDAVKPSLEKEKNRKGVKPKPKKKLRRGRVTKRRRTTAVRHMTLRRAPRKKTGVNRRDTRTASVSTIFSRLSSRGGANAACPRCGHHCCGRRFKPTRQQKLERKTRRKYVRQITKKIRETELKQKKRDEDNRKREQRWSKAPVIRQREKRKVGDLKKGKQRETKKHSPEKKDKKRGQGPNSRKETKERERTKKKVEENHQNNKKRGDLFIRDCKDFIDTKSNQAGSRAAMLSPLYVQGGVDLSEDQPMSEEENFAPITPEVIYQSLRQLSGWKESNNVTSIADYIGPDTFCKEGDNTKITSEKSEELVEKSEITMYSEVNNKQESESNKNLSEKTDQVADSSIVRPRKRKFNSQEGDKYKISLKKSCKSFEDSTVALSGQKNKNDEHKKNKHLPAISNTFLHNSPMIASIWQTSIIQDSWKNKNLTETTHISSKAAITSSWTANKGQRNTTNEMTAGKSNITKYVSVSEQENKRRRLSEPETIYLELKNSREYDNSLKENNFEEFGKSVALQLQSLELQVALAAQKQIQTYLNEIRHKQIETGIVGSTLVKAKVLSSTDSPLPCSTISTCASDHSSVLQSSK